MIAKNYKCRLTRIKDGRIHVPDTYEKEFEIAIADTGLFNYSAEDIYQEIKKMILPKDILLEMINNWDATLPEGSPFNILEALAKDGYKDISVIKNGPLFKTGRKENETLGYKLIVYRKDEIVILKHAIWNESSLCPVEWKRSEKFKKALELGPLASNIREWWM